ncbi:MAG: GNAT family N-acetyltransferase [Pseudomonadota bacterium]
MIENRLATLPELRDILGWAAEEGWNPGLDDAEAFYAADPQGFFVSTEGDKPFGAISVVNHNDEAAFLGLYIVKPQYRGRGLGLSLWNHAFAHAGPRVVGLDGVPAQQANYVKSGFVWAGKTKRYAGPLGGTTSDAVREAEGADHTRLMEMEFRGSWCRKPAFLSAWLSNTANRRTLVATQNGEIAGFATVRKCRNGAKIGPLVAETIEVADALIQHAATLFDGGVIIDVPATSQTLEQLCLDYGFASAFETARMYRGAAPQGESMVFAVSTLELG